MAKTIKKKDFVEIEYTGRLANEGYIFDTTEESVAKENGLYNPEVRYGSVITCVGERLVLAGLDDSLIGKEAGKEYDIRFNSEDAFGKKSANLIKLVPASVFKKQNITPMPGLQVTFDGGLGTIKTVSGGRILVDFNHPLAGKDLVYHVKVNRFVTDKKEQIKALLELKMNIKREEVFVKLEDGRAEISQNTELPEEIEKQVSDFIKSCVSINDIKFKKSGKTSENR